MTSPTLDFLSPQFDPVEALYAASFEVPYPQVKPLDNLSRCRAILPPEVPESLAHHQLKPGSSESKAKHLYMKSKAVKLNDAAAAEGAASAMQSVFDAVKPGPLGLLKKWHSSASKVKVVTRHCSGVRGTAVGTIAAYDRFMNLVLKDVSETYTVLVKVPRVQGRSTAAADQDGTGAASGAGASAPSCEHGDQAEPKGKVRWCRKQELRKRTLHQVFLKGDNIVLISCAADAPSTSTAHREQLA